MQHTYHDGLLPLTAAAAVTTAAAVLMAAAVLAAAAESCRPGAQWEQSEYLITAARCICSGTAA